MRINKHKQPLFLAVIFFLPLLSANRGYGYEQIKVLFFILSITLIGFLWMGKQVKWTLISKAARLFILILLITSIFGIDPKSSLLGNPPYFQGWILYSYLFLFYLMVKTFKIKLKTYAIVLLSSALLVSFLAIKDWVLLNLLSQQVPIYAGRVVSTFGQPNFYAGFLLLTLPFCYLLLKDSDKKLQFLGWGSGVMAMIGIMISYSRSGIFLALILLILALLDQLKIKFKLLLGATMVIIGAVFFSINSSSGFVWQEFLQPATVDNPDLTRQSVEKRIYIWPLAYQAGQQRFLTGYGLENIGLTFSNYFKEFKHALFEENLKILPVLISLKDLYLDRTHNYLLDLFLFSGILGVSVWIFLVIMLFKKLQSKSDGRHKMILFTFLILYLFWTAFQNQSVVHLMYFWLLVGLVDKKSDI